MRITEKVLVILFFIGFVMIQGKVPGGGVLTSLSSVLLALLYTLFGFALFNGIGFKGIFKRSSYNGVGIANIVIAIICGIILAGSVVAVVFNVEHWPGAAVLTFGYVLPLSMICIMSAILTITKKRLGVPVLIRALPTLLVIFYYIYKYSFPT